MFLACLIFYFVNRWIFKSAWETGFVHSHFNDLICIPFWVPIMLAGQKHVGWRSYDGPPLASEILIPLFVWSWIFEGILPSFQLGSRPMVADYLDVVYYALGALFSACFWKVWYSCTPRPT